MRNIKILLCLGFTMLAVVSLMSRGTRVSSQTGGSPLSAPTGVTASDGVYNNKVTVWWDTIRGATTYRIFRNTINDSSSATALGTSVSNTFFDTTAPQGQTFYYWVRAENGSAVSSLSTADTGVRANGTQTGPLLPLEPPPGTPAANPITATKTYLGKALFWDEQLSSTRTVSCGTCHHLSTGGVDLRSAGSPTGHINPGPDNLFGTPDDIRGSSGIPSTNPDGTYMSIAGYGLNDQVTGRRSVPAVNAAYFPELFWDGRANGVFRDPITNAIIYNAGGALESQAAGPPVNSTEMAHGGRNWTDIAVRVSGSKPLALVPSMPTALSTWIGGRTYPELFDEAFGTPDVTPARIIMAIATYERTLYSDQTKIDLDAQGIQALNAQEQRGRNAFNASSCAVCHAGNLFTDNSFRYIGVRPQNEDTGRSQVTGNNQNTGEFRVPSLRNAALRGTFFHNGNFTTLNQVVAFYNRGGDFNGPNKPNNLIRPLGLNAGAQADIVAFIQAMTDPRVANETGPFDRPTLYMESNRVPAITGTGRAGSGNVVPQIKAISPPLAGNPNFTVSVNSALGNANAVLVIDETDPGTPASIPATGSLARVTAVTQNTGAANGWASISLPIPATANVVGRTFFARWYITDPAAANGFSVSQAARFTVFGEASAPSRAKFVDFDGDSKTDISVFRPAEGAWYILRSGDNVVTASQFGVATDKLVPADYDGDGKSDVAVYRNGTWFIQRSRDGFAVVNFGLATDIPQPGDFDGDGKADPAVYRPSDGTWYIMQSRDGFLAVQFGVSTDKPVAADFDGDGRTDQAVYRNGIWYLNRSRDGFYAAQFGLSDDLPVVGDYDGDGRSDMAVFRPSTGTWFAMRSSAQNYFGIGFGLSTDLPAPGDYDGDGASDLAVFRNDGGMWFLLNPGSGSFRAQQFGASGDKPAPGYIVP